MRPRVVVGQMDERRQGGDSGVIRFVVHSRSPPLLVHVAATLHLALGNQWQANSLQPIMEKVIRQLILT
jgi:hypothetical protein